MKIPCRHKWVFNRLVDHFHQTSSQICSLPGSQLMRPVENRCGKGQVELILNRNIHLRKDIENPWYIITSRDLTHQLILHTSWEVVHILQKYRFFLSLVLFSQAQKAVSWFSQSPVGIEREPPNHCRPREVLLPAENMFGYELYNESG